MKVLTVRSLILLVMVGIVFIAVLYVPALSRAGTPPYLSEGRTLYQWYCSPCHGIDGDGKGDNARYLDPKPADHTNSENMSKRTDEKLFDTIYGGGKAVAKSTYMPPWGATLTEKQIQSLVKYIRELCKCEGPR
jgi:mono/diheme cytochrome c family protein